MKMSLARRLRRFCGHSSGRCSSITVGMAAEEMEEKEKEEEEEEDGRCIHDQVVRAYLEKDTLLGSLIVGMYSSQQRVGAMDDAHCWFSSILLPSLSVDSYTWHHLITGYAHHGMPHLVLHTFWQMQHQGTPLNRFIAATILSTVSLDLISHGEHLHACLIGTSNCDMHDIVVNNAIITMYGRCNRLDRAQRMFDSMSERRILTWTAIIAAHAQNGHTKEALHLFGQMHKEGVMPNDATFVSILCTCDVLSLGKYLHSRISAMGLEVEIMVANSVIGMYGKCGSMADALASFDRMENQRSTSWNAFMTAHIENTQFSGVLQLFQQMLQEALLPDRVTYINAFSACSHRATMCEVRRLHSCATLMLNHLDTTVQNALLNAYAKCSTTVEQTSMVFLDISEPDEVSWTALISSAAQHGNMHRALCLLDVMQRNGIMANEVTILSILYGCSHVGMMDECIRCVLFMKSMMLPPFVEHYNCILDLVARMGQLSEANIIASSMPCQPSLASWMILLVACKNQFDQCDCKLGEDAASHIFELQSQNFASLVLLTQIYDAVTL